MTSPQRLELADMVAELTQPHTHREHYTIRRGHTWYGEDHVTRTPALLLQLQFATPSGQGEERTNTGFTSRPAARLEALDTLLRIDQEAARWVRRLGYDDPGDELEVVRRTSPPAGPACVRCAHASCTAIRRGEVVVRRPIPGSGTAACIRLLHSLTPQLDEQTRRDVTREVRRWWTWARIATGWDSPAWQPDNTCPVCGERGTLRINLVSELAVCVHDSCREAWEASTLGLLAEHIRQESEQERTPPVKPVPCACRWPMSGAGRWGLCPVCGSSVCVNAEVVAEREAVLRDRAREAARLAHLQRIAAAATVRRSARVSERMTS